MLGLDKPDIILKGARVEALGQASGDETGPVLHRVAKGLAGNEAPLHDVSHSWRWGERRTVIDDENSRVKSCWVWMRR